MLSLSSSRLIVAVEGLMKTIFMITLFVSSFAAQAGTVLFCNNDQRNCIKVASEVEPSAGFQLASSSVTPLDCSSSCKGECRIEYKDCLRDGTSKTECAALRANCETHCHD